ncbi:hypothetical protein [Ramlibacter sp. WS9]|nr:hypothetical protein [Ramlibacter sp. WS9]
MNALDLMVKGDLISPDEAKWTVEQAGAFVEEIEGALRAREDSHD